ncbi:MAG: PspA/IM30 family protein, partial [Boseongicola sp.]|nr:PspA/IM30 family protein [Boseongicola sp.]
MFATLRVLFDGERARTEDRLKDTYAIELIEQRIREAESNLSSAKLTLASLIQRRRSERRLTDTLDKRIATLE